MVGTAIEPLPPTPPLAILIAWAMLGELSSALAFAGGALWR
jgi:hypothetical protein